MYYERKYASLRRRCAPDVAARMRLLSPTQLAEGDAMSKRPRLDEIEKLNAEIGMWLSQLQAAHEERDAALARVKELEATLETLRAENAEHVETQRKFDRVLLDVRAACDRTREHNALLDMTNRERAKRMRVKDAEIARLRTALETEAVRTADGPGDIVEIGDLAFVIELADNDRLTAREKRE